MGLVPRFRSVKTQCRVKRLHGGGNGITVNPDDQLIIKLPDSRVLKVIARSVLLALAIITSPWLGSLIIWDSSVSYSAVASEVRIHGESLLPVLLRDLTSEALFKSGDKALFVSRHGDDDEVTAHGAQILNAHDMDLVSESDAERQSSIPDGTFDFVFASGFLAGKFIDRILKTGGIVAIQLSSDPSNAFHKPSNYKIVYLRQFESTVLAMKKTGPVETNSPTKRRLCALSSEAKRAALNGLEDVLLEPPRASSGKKSDKYLKRTKYLPDLMGDSLEQYPRRLFIDVGLHNKNGNGSPIWFSRNYPTRNRDFEIYKIETLNEELLDDGVPQMSMSDWLKKNVREEEYVVMKAEAEVVEEMVKNRAICLVDELFLECEHQGLGGRKNKSKRAYWECLALYGRLRDEGVAVHQWWG
ncbi:uncharacterized protein LOC122077520 [Macadamia integrifolia]|uniref:uncharacterized protein LOC122077520 n=1 Tax=Macadamia integrifolia TaxID=60698 RepID=UPI001C4E37B2|nr:uncharacterized protein LOC122077520 [Macadamia integrifolia]